MTKPRTTYKHDLPKVTIRSTRITRFQRLCKKYKVSQQEMFEGMIAIVDSHPAAIEKYLPVLGDE